MKAKKLSDKVAGVAGASKGIGATIAKHLAVEGAAAVVNYSSSKTEPDKVVSEIKARGGKAIAAQADLSKPVGGLCRAFRRLFLRAGGNIKAIEAVLTVVIRKIVHATDEFSAQAAPQPFTFCD